MATPRVWSSRNNKSDCIWQLTGSERPDVFEDLRLGRLQTPLPSRSAQMAEHHENDDFGLTM
jgi:hypothetical protein